LPPRYDGPPALRVEVPVADPSVPLIRQRRRLAATLAALEPKQWATPSRCAGWSVQDVLAHLVGVNHFWAASIRAGRAGAPTRYLLEFDPVTTPPLLIEPLRSLAPAAVLDQFVEGVDDLADALDGVDGEAWSILAESPPGHVDLRALTLHALWDGWVHERDVLLPLGMTPVVVDDEVTASLMYAAVLGPTIWAASGHTTHGALAVQCDDPTFCFVVEAGTTVVARLPGPDDRDLPELCGSAVSLVEGLSARIPLRHRLAADDQWLVNGVSELFDPAG
jgi:uncharacterized protein (TIGR03083 family)